MKNSIKTLLSRVLLVMMGVGTVSITVEEVLAKINYVPPKGKKAGTKGAKIGASIRSPSSDGSQQRIIALLPTQKGLESFLSKDSSSEDEDLTLLYVTQEQPSFAFYLPKVCPGEGMCSLIFDLYQGDGRQGPVWSEQMPWLRSGGLMLFSMQDSSVLLESGITYRWRLRVLDAQGNKLLRYALNGDFERGESSIELQQALAQATSPQEQYLAYAQNGDWLAMMSGVLQAYQENPSDEQIREDWESALALMEIQCGLLPPEAGIGKMNISLTCIDLAGGE